MNPTTEPTEHEEHAHEASTDLLVINRAMRRQREPGRGNTARRRNAQLSKAWKKIRARAERIGNPASREAYVRNRLGGLLDGSR